MKITIICSSQRRKSQTLKVGQYFAEQVPLAGFQEADIYDLVDLNIPMWDGNDKEKKKCNDWNTIRQSVYNSDALITLTPEWSGTASPLLKNFLMMLEPAEASDKPILFVSVVRGISGAYPIAELRMNSLKNNRMIAIPDHLIIRNVEDVLNEAVSINNNDQNVREKIYSSLLVLNLYSHALHSVRRKILKKPLENRPKYGM
ncbi:NAD(P)H-dependent oxidoreductase [Candidatus Sororendozoicomonas aggregata]|uniref:NADPH-dependent FMN reductase n=1 Tax=Candidatus Sororendozoicomonas aggregata TaxID=3073239 RepID=UPI002ED51D9A